MRVMWWLSYYLAISLIIIFANGSKFAHEMLIAAEKGDTDKVVEMITQKGVFITTKNNYGVSALLFAANNGHLPLVKKLLSMGADIEDRANSWKTPLLCAAQWGHYDVVMHLVESGANISVYDNSGMTAVMSATMNGHVTVVRYLLAKGASPTAVNFVNGTALSIAKAKGHAELVKLFEPFFPSEWETNTFYIAYEIITRNTIHYTKLILQQVQEIAIEFWTAYNTQHTAVQENAGGYSKWSEEPPQTNEQTKESFEDTKSVLLKLQQDRDNWEL